MWKFGRNTLIGLFTIVFLANGMLSVTYGATEEIKGAKIVEEEKQPNSDLAVRVQAAGEEINATLQKYECILDARVSLGSDGMRPEIRILGLPEDLEPPKKPNEIEEK